MDKITTANKLDSERSARPSDVSIFRTWRIAEV